MARPFPTLATFVIFRRDARPDEAAPPRPAPDEDEDAPRADGLPSNILFFLSRTTLSDESRTRTVGLAQGMVDFAQMMGQGLGSQDGKGIRVVKSARQRMLYLEAETGLWICAMVNLPRPVPAGSKLSATITSTSTSQSSSSPPSDEAMLASLRRGYLEFRLLHGSFAYLSEAGGKKRVEEALQKFWSVWVWRWDVERSVHGSIDFAEHLGSLNVLPTSSRITSSLRAQLSQFVSDICPQAHALPILLYGSSVLHLPTPSHKFRASAEDVTTLALYLVSLLHGSEATPETPARSAADRSPRSEDKEAKSKWSGLGLGLGSLGGFLSNTAPSTSGTSKSAAAAAPDQSDGQAARGTPPTGAATSRWAHRAISWALPSSTASNATDRAEEADDLDAQLRREMGLPPLQKPDPPGSSEATPSAPPPAPLPPLPPSLTTDSPLLGSPMPPLSLPEASRIPLPEGSAHDPRAPGFSVENALADAMTEAEKRQILAQLALAEDGVRPEEREVDDEGAKPEDCKEEEAQPVEKAEEGAVDEQVVLKKLEVFVGQDAEAGRRDAPAKVFWLQRGHVTLALLMPQIAEEGERSMSSHDLIAQGSQLVAAFASRLGTMPPRAVPSAEQRFLLRSPITGLAVQRSSLASSWISRDETWSGKTAAPKDVQASRALLDCQAFFNMEPPSSETFVRTGTGQWVVAKRSATTSVQTGKLPVDTYLVLPVGAGTLIDADGELKKLAGAYQQVAGL